MEQLEVFSRDDLRILRNTIYAKYGYRFNSKDLQEHFSDFLWYNGITNNVDNKLTAVDIGNIELVQKAEQNYSEKNYSTNVSIGSAYLDMSSQMYDDLLFILDRNNMENFFRSVYYNSENERRNTNRLLTIAINFYNEGNYEASIDNLINARKGNRRNYGLVYYYLGLCLIEIDSLELAKQSFKEAIDYFYYAKVRQVDFGLEHLFSYDDNGLGREPYFAFYHLAYIESFQNNIDLAYEYLCEALYHGYPYIDHIRSDNNMINLFRDRNRLRAIESVYNAGADNNLIGKYYNLDVSGGLTQYIYFGSRYTLGIFISHENGQLRDNYTYEIKNYIMFSEVFNRYGEWGDYNTYVKQFEGLDYHGINFEEVSRDEMDWNWK
jgi:hypothetical protein